MAGSPNALCLESLAQVSTVEFSTVYLLTYSAETSVEVSDANGKLGMVYIYGGGELCDKPWAGNDVLRVERRVEVHFSCGAGDQTQLVSVEEVSTCMYFAAVCD